MTIDVLEKPATIAGGDLGDLIEALGFARYAIGNDALRLQLQGVRLDIDTRGLHVWATCGMRLHCTVLSHCRQPGSAASQFLLRAADVQMLLKKYATKSSRCGLQFTVNYAIGVLDVGRRDSVCDLQLEHWAGVDGDRWEMLLSGYDRVMPRNPEVVASLYADRLLPIVRAAVAGSQKAFQAVKFEAKTDNSYGLLDLSVNIPTRGARCGEWSDLSMSTRLTSVHVPRDVTTGYNAAFLRDAIAAIGEKSLLRWRVGDPQGPAIFDGASDDQFVLIMPIRV